jgi:putative NIF3 family GTP cyclohydrolase 1 type 2
MYATCALLEFVYNGKKRVAEVDKCRVVKGRTLVVAYQAASTPVGSAIVTGESGYRSFYADKMENVRVS